MEWCIVRMYVELSNGFSGLKERAHFFPGGAAHGYLDVTDRPMPTIDARPRTSVVIDYNKPGPKRGQQMDQSKPPYRVPTMTEIRAIPWNGYNVISTFSGGGGSSLGYRMAGYKVLWASEFIDAARDTYNANKADYTIVDGRDIRNVTGSEILSAIGLSQGELDLFDGSPPCASFSTAGKREAGWGKVKKYSDKAQRTDDLFFEFTRLLNDLQPKTFVAENVSGLVKGTAKGYFIEIMRALKACGYSVACKVLDAQWLGVPQARQRTIFVGVREDLRLAPAHPKPLPYRYTVLDALPHIHERGAVDSTGYGEIEPDSDMKRYEVGREWERMQKPGTQSDKYFQLVRPSIIKPCPTVTQKGGHSDAESVAHPLENRKFTIAELKRLCAFPDDFVLTGTYAQKWERMGRAVPPVMMKHIGETIRDRILARVQQ